MTLGEKSNIVIPSASMETDTREVEVEADSHINDGKTEEEEEGPPLDVVQADLEELFDAILGDHMKRFLDLSSKVDALKRAKLKLDRKRDDSPPKVTLYYKSTGEELPFKGADSIYRDYKLEIKKAKLKAIDVDIANWQKEIDKVIEEAKSICQTSIIDSNSTLARYAKVLDFGQQFKNLERMLTLKVFQRGLESERSLKRIENEIALKNLNSLSKANKASGQSEQKKADDLVSTLSDKVMDNISDKVMDHISEIINIPAPSNPHKRKRVESEEMQRSRTKKQTTLNNLTQYSNKGNHTKDVPKTSPKRKKRTLTKPNNRSRIPQGTVVVTDSGPINRFFSKNTNKGPSSSYLRVSFDEYFLPYNQLPVHLKDIVLPAPDSVHILSEGIRISDTQRKILALGVDFIPKRSLTHSFIGRQVAELQEEFDLRFKNALRWKHIFSGSKSKVPDFYVKTNRAAYEVPEVEDYLRYVERRIGLLGANLPKPDPRNRDDVRIKELYRLILDNDLIIKEADKNLGITLLKLSDYNDEVKRQLSNERYYKREDPSLLDQTIWINRIWNSLDRGSDNDLRGIIQRIKHYILNHPGFKDPKVPLFYINPKIHKTPWSGRPIVASLQWITTPYSIIVSHYLQKLVKRYATNLTVITHSTQLIERITKLQSNLTAEQIAKLVMQAGDIVNMYTNLLIKDCMDAFDWAVDKDRISNDPVIPSALIAPLRLMLEFVLKYNFLKDPATGIIYRQHSGIAMGSNCSADLANLTCFYLEFSQVTKRPPLLLTRYLDDLFAIRTSESKLNLDYGSSMGILWTEPSRSVDYLDMRISFSPSEGFTFKVHQKPLNAYQYPHYDSNISISVKRGFIKGELIRYVRICSKQFDYNWMREIFMARLLHRGYPKSFINPIYKQVPWALKSSFSLPPDTTNSKKDAPIPLIFRVKYDDRLQLHRFIGSDLRRGWKRLILDHDFVTKVQPPMICHTIQRKLRSDLIRADYKKLEEHMRQKLSLS